MSSPRLASTSSSSSLASPLQRQGESLGLLRHEIDPLGLRRPEFFAARDRVALLRRALRGGTIPSLKPTIARRPCSNEIPCSDEMR